MRILSSVFLALTIYVSTTAVAASAASMIGSWSGRGSVRLTLGQVERVSCRVSYEKGDSAGKTIVLNARCAAAGGTFLLYGRISQRGTNRYRGVLFSEQSTMSGKVDITLRGNTQTARVAMKEAREVPHSDGVR